MRPAGLAACRRGSGKHCGADKYPPLQSNRQDRALLALPASQTDGTFSGGMVSATVAEVPVGSSLCRITHSGLPAEVSLTSPWWAYKADFELILSRALSTSADFRVSIGTQTGPPIGVQKGPLSLRSALRSMMFLCSADKGPFLRPSLILRRRCAQSRSRMAFRPPPEAARSVLDGGCAQRQAWTGRVFRSGTVLEPPALVAGLDDVAMVGQAVEQRRCHFGVAKYAGPFAEGEIGRYDH